MEAQDEDGCWTAFGDSEATAAAAVETVAAAGEATAAGDGAVGMGPSVVADSADLAVVKEPAAVTSNSGEFPNQRHYFCQ